MRITGARATLVAGVLGLLVVAAAAWLLLVGPATATLADTRTQHAETVDANQLLTVRLHGAQRQRDELATTVAAAAALETMVPATADQPGFFRMLDAAATAAGIDPAKVTTLSPTVPVTAADLAATSGEEVTGSSAFGDLAVQTVTVTVEASYDEVRQLLQQLDELDRAFLVQDVTLATVDGTTTAQLVGTTYVAPPLEAPEVTR